MEAVITVYNQQKNYSRNSTKSQLKEKSVVLEL